MENEIVQFLVYALVISALGGANAYILARGLPQVALAYDAFWQLVARIIPIMRRLFDPNTQLAKALKAKGIDPALADRFAELGADVLEAMAKPYLPSAIDTAPPAGAERP